jgi:hypothetical protein
MKRLIYRWKWKNDGLVLRMAGGLNPGQTRVFLTNGSGSPAGLVQ